MNKKANLESPNILVVIFVAAVTIIATILAINAAAPAFASDATASGLISAVQLMLNRIGNTGMVMAAFALILFNMVGAFFLVTNPIFMIIDIIFMPFTILLAAVLSNAYESGLQPITSSLGLATMDFLLTNLPIIIVVADIATAIVAYALIKDRFQ